MNQGRNIIKPKCLKVGDKVGIATLSAPEAFENPDRVDRGVKNLVELGFEVLMAPHALSSAKGYLAESPELLAQDLNDLFADPTVSAIVCTGGGTNANRLLPFIDYDTVRKHPKIIIGISNPTVVLNAVFAKTNLVTFHGPVLVWNFGSEMPSYTLKSFMRALMQSEAIGTIESSNEWSFIKCGIAEGRLVGGNLWSLQSLLGTEYEPDWTDKILFWEDIAKEPKRIDAILTHLKLAGVFEKIHGMIIGRLVDCEPNGPSLTVNEIVEELCDEYRFPILSGVSLGHTDEKLTLPIGAMARMQSEDRVFCITENSVVAC